MGMAIDRIEAHLSNNDLLNEMQAGFTKQRRAEDNLTILKECIEAAFIGRRQLIAIAIDYKRAYDSIKREKFITVLKYYKIDTKIIDSIVRIYENDSTNIKLREGINQNFKITSGIRQGCTHSHKTSK